MKQETSAVDRPRIDKWLWAARFYKTRALATAAVKGGKVHVNDERIKPGRLMRRGDVLRIKRGDDEMTVILRELSSRRGSAVIAQQLYEETAQSIEARQADSEQRRLLRANASPRPARRPGKKERRDLIHFFGRGEN